MYSSFAGVMVFFTVLVFALAVVLVREIRARQRVDEVWTKVADRLGGTFIKKADIGSGFHQLATSRLTVSIEGREVVVVSGTGKAIQMRLSAADTSSDDLKLEVHPKSALLSLLPGTEVVRVGERTFDGKFLVKANGEHLARLWIDGGIRRAVTAAGSYGFVVSEGKVTAHRGGLENDETKLIAAITATARLARRGTDLERQWRKMAGKLGRVEPNHDGRWPAIDVSADGVSMHIEVESELGPGCQTVVVAQPRRPSWERFVLGNPRPDWALKLRRVADTRWLAKPLFSDEPSRTATWLTELREQLDSLQARGMSFDGQRVHLGLEGIVFEEQRLRAAVDFVALLCRRMDADPYR
jgi:hypothetical protein